MQTRERRARADRGQAPGAPRDLGLHQRRDPRPPRRQQRVPEGAHLLDEPRQTAAGSGRARARRRHAVGWARATSSATSAGGVATRARARRDLGVRRARRRATNTGQYALAAVRRPRAARVELGGAGATSRPTARALRSARASAGRSARRSAPSAARREAGSQQVVCPKRKRTMDSAYAESIRSARAQDSPSHGNVILDTSMSLDGFMTADGPDHGGAPRRRRRGLTRGRRRRGGCRLLDAASAPRRGHLRAHDLRRPRCRGGAPTGPPATPGAPSSS